MTRSPSSPQPLHPHDKQPSFWQAPLAWTVNRQLPTAAANRRHTHGWSSQDMRLASFNSIRTTSLCAANSGRRTCACVCVTHAGSVGARGNVIVFPRDRGHAGEEPAALGCCAVCPGHGGRGTTHASRSDTAPAPKTQLVMVVTGGCSGVKTGWPRAGRAATWLPGSSDGPRDTKESRSRSDLAYLPNRHFCPCLTSLSLPASLALAPAWRAHTPINRQMAAARAFIGFPCASYEVNAPCRLQVCRSAVLCAQWRRCRCQPRDRASASAPAVRSTSDAVAAAATTTAALHCCLNQVHPP